MKSVCVYCGSSDEVDEKYLQLARQVGQELAQRGLDLVYGGGSTGMMGAVADEMLKRGRQVIGILPRIFDKPSMVENNLTRLELVDSMHARKARMLELSDALVALPGGFGTMDEFFEALTWEQIGLHTKPIGMLNAFGYYDDLLAFLQHANQEGFTYWEHQQLYPHSDDPATLLDMLAAYQPPEGLARWMDR